MQALLFERGKATCFALGVERVVDLGDVLRLASTKPKNEPTHVACTYFPVARGFTLATCFNCSSTVEASLIRQAGSKVRLTFIQALQAARQIVPPFFAPRRVRTCEPRMMALGQKWELGRLHADVEILAIRWDEASMPAYHVPEMRPVIGANPGVRQMVDSSQLTLAPPSLYFPVTSVFRAEIVSCSPRAVISASVGSTRRAFIARPRKRFILHTWVLSAELSRFAAEAIKCSRSLETLPMLPWLVTDMKATNSIATRVEPAMSPNACDSCLHFRRGAKDSDAFGIPVSLFIFGLQAFRPSGFKMDAIIKQAMSSLSKTNQP